MLRLAALQGVVALLLALLVACGGSGGGGGGGNNGEGVNGDVAAYLDHMEGLQNRYNTIRLEGSTALDGLDLEDPSTWSSAGNEMTAVRDRFNQLAAEVAALEAPPALREAHADYVQSVQLQGQLLDELQDLVEEAETALEAGDESAVAGIEGASADIDDLGDPISTLRSNWRTAVMAEASRQDITVPSWVERVGTQG